MSNTSTGLIYLWTVFTLKIQAHAQIQIYRCIFTSYGQNHQNTFWLLFLFMLTPWLTQWNLHNHPNKMFLRLSLHLQVISNVNCPTFFTSGGNVIKFCVLTKRHVHFRFRPFYDRTRWLVFTVNKNWGTRWQVSFSLVIERERCLWQLIHAIKGSSQHLHVDCLLMFFNVNNKITIAK